MNAIARLRELLDPNTPEFMSYAENVEALALVTQLEAALADAELRGWKRAQDESAAIACKLWEDDQETAALVIEKSIRALPYEPEPEPK